MAQTTTPSWLAEIRQYWAELVAQQEEQRASSQRFWGGTGLGASASALSNPRPMLPEPRFPLALPGNSTAANGQRDRSDV